VVRALDEVGDRDDVADALAPVLAKKSSHGGSVHQCPSVPSRVVDGM
jgi:hypothetical protein